MRELLKYKYANEFKIKSIKTRSSISPGDLRVVEMIKRRVMESLKRLRVIYTDEDDFSEVAFELKLRRDVISHSEVECDMLGVGKNKRGVVVWADFGKIEPRVVSIYRYIGRREGEMYREIMPIVVWFPDHDVAFNMVPSSTTEDFFFFFNENYSGTSYPGIKFIRGGSTRSLLMGWSESLTYYIESSEYEKNIIQPTTRLDFV